MESAEFQLERGKKMTEGELILLLCKEIDFGEEESEEVLIKKFKERYQGLSDLIRKASQGDSNALMRLRWQCGLKVIT